jgi:phosphoribosylformylglycinamidine synthase subunit PurL
MLLVAERGREQEIYSVFEKWGLDAVTVGVVTDDGMMRVKHHGTVCAEIPNRILADEAPRYNRPTTRPLRTAPQHGPEWTSNDLTADLKALLESGDICSKRWIWEQYDHQVRTNTVAGPGLDAAVVRIKETGTSIAMALDGNGRYCSLDPREGTRLIVAECCRNLSTVGALPVATTNNLNFGNPERPEIMAQIVESIEGLAEACQAFQVPVTGGNVSLYNETLGTPIFPTPVVGIVGTLPTVVPPPIHFPATGLHVLLLGGLRDSNWDEFGGTQYAKVILNSLWGKPPALDFDYELAVQKTIRELVRAGLVQSAHDLSKGGLAVALAESSFGPANVGAAIDLDSNFSPELLLFHEGPSRVMVSTADVQAIEDAANRNGIQALRIGVTLEARLAVRNRNEILIDSPVDELKTIWSTGLVNLLQDPVLV